MKILKWVSLLFLVACLVLVVQYLSGWQDIPDSSPSVEELYSHEYQMAAKKAMEHLISAHQKLNTPALTAAVSVAGQVVWAGAVGFQDLEEARPATLHTKFRIGSTSKALTATVLARAVDRDLVDLDTPIRRYVKDLPNKNWEKMTPRQLASHMSGLPDYESNSDLLGGWRTWNLTRQYDDVRDALDIFDDADLVGEPGDQFLYTSFDVNLLSVVLQEVTRMPFLDFMDRIVFGPLGMKNTGADYANRTVDNRAVFYDRRGERVKPWRRVNLSQKWAGGGLLSTSSDLVRLGKAYFDADFIRPETVKEFWTPQRLNNGEVNEQGYALGWRFHLTERLGAQTPSAHHGGVSKGAMSWLILYPDYQMAVALNMNSRIEPFGEFAAKETAIAEAFMEVAREKLTHH